MLDQSNDSSSRERDVLRVGRPGADEAQTKPADDEEQNEEDGGESGDDQHDKPSGPQEKKPSIWRRHPLAILIGAVVLIALIVAGVLYYLHARHFENTDDAFIDSRPVSVSAEVTGNITEVPVTDNQLVHPGDLLVRIDERNYTAAVENAQGQIDAAQASFDNYDAQVSAQKSQLKQAEQQVSEAEAALSFSKDQDARAQQLVKTGFGTVQNAQQTASDLLQKQASLDAAIASRNGTDKQIGALKAQRRNAEAQVEQAKAQKATADANLSRTQIHATVDGRVTRLTGAVGFVASSGQVLMVLAPLDVWVTANFKENQLTDMRVGQPVDIEIDAYGKTYPGKINSIQAGSGTAFSLLPAQNATGNYVKVVQRVPVKITFDERPDVELGPGMSVVPTVRVR